MNVCTCYTDILKFLSLVFFLRRYSGLVWTRSISFGVLMHGICNVGRRDGIVELQWFSMVRFREWVRNAVVLVWPGQVSR